ncbi:hypothetical protein MICAG_1700023 [Microcystis aeruginosa PCC 9808]|uniref:Uncharacterized protein n=1 Tax=Microcystis aeruginosa PCC 9808 TaxID=1160284 RepID=I4HJS5_MICAE|nr:hypothetical protein MICAG_1700023 [Microcystis aeruginosa PCC 9808]
MSDKIHVSEEVRQAVEEERV